MRDAPEIVQRETALMWFGLNLEPYSLGPGPWFGFAEAEQLSDGTDNIIVDGEGSTVAIEPKIAGLDQGAWAPAPLAAKAVLADEFGGVLPPPLIEALGAQFPGEWMWKAEPDPTLGDAGQLPSSWADLAPVIIERLDILEGMLRDLQPAPGEIGHNMPPDDEGFTAADQRETQAAIVQARSATLAGIADAGPRLEASAQRLDSTSTKIINWLLRRADDFGTEAAKSLGKEFGRIIILLIVAYFCSDLAGLLEQGARILGHG